MQAWPRLKLVHKYAHIYASDNLALRFETFYKELQNASK
jgi:hypothetical protein